jgi:hypothetical protein
MVSLILCIFRIIKRIATLGKVYSPLAGSSRRFTTMR